jgi:thiamine-phosphate diphosphorylase
MAQVCAVRRPKIASMSASAKLPFAQGVWAIGSDLGNAEEAKNWAQPLAHAACLTLRRPPSPDAEALATWRALFAHPQGLAVHARLDLALLHPTAGVIAGVRSLPVPALRRLLPAPRALGVSVHDTEEAKAAEAEGADYLIFGPVWETPEKAGILPARGVQALENLVRSTELPVVAIGGIEGESQVRQAQDAGAQAVAVLRAAQNPQRFAALCKAWS